ncbi:MAG: SpoIIE family protein phosphatase [Chitinivibrionales bacterium]|nr:SpoIIE family protein phosphatase [Chitinivibrionales bacterium]
MCRQSKSVNVTASPKLFANRRPTVGFLAEGLVDWYHSGVWSGLADASRTAGCNLLCIAGGALGSSPLDPWEHQRNAVYPLANQHVVDALILTSSLANFVDDDAFGRFLANLGDLPTVSLAPSRGCIPSVFVDNQRGMRALMQHLLDEHGYRRFAFIRGPEANREADVRFETCRRALADYGVGLSPECIYDGDFTMEAGARAVTAMLDGKHQADVVVAVNDLSALGALHALRERGCLVPEEIAIVGFDDIEQAACSHPPLTTVRQPLAALGAAAVDNVTRLMRGERACAETKLSAQLVLRRSCGCHAGYARQWGSESAPTAVMRTDELVNVLMDECEGLDETGSGPDRDLLMACVSAFMRDIDSGTVTQFGSIIERIAWEEQAYGRGLLQWQRVLFGLRTHVAASCDTPDARTRAEHLLHEGAVILGQAEQRLEAAYRIDNSASQARLRETSMALANSVGFRQLMQSIAERLPSVGIEGGRLYLYEPYHGDSRTVREAVSFGRTHVHREGDDRVLTMEQCAPVGSVPGEEPQVWTVLPLFFQDEQFGYALVDAGSTAPETLETVRQDISGAVRSTLLMDTVRRQSHELTRANAQLSELREREQQYLATLRHDLELGRRIQRGFLPEQLPQPAGWDIASAFAPAREVSGDFYDAFMLDDTTLAFVVADVCGKNVGAALFGALVHTLVHVFGERAAQNGRRFDRAVVHMNEYIARHYRQMRDAIIYATLVFGTLDCRTGGLNYINAGHTRPLLIRPSGDSVELESTGPALGISVNSSFDMHTAALGPGEQLFVYTDGVTDIRRSDGEFFSRARLLELLRNPARGSAERIEQVRDALRSFGGDEPPFDDITMLAITRAVVREPNKVIDRAAFEASG